MCTVINRAALEARDADNIAQTEWLTFKPSPIHGWGAFARKFVPRGTHVIEYVGDRIDKQESLRRCEQNNECIFALDNQYDLDGNVEWNPARLINHSCTPNCEAENEAGHIWIIAARDLHPDEEVTFNYGYDLTDYKEHPCRCGSAECAGYIVADEFLDHVRKQQADRRGP